jgi:F-type H+-transporting ATPase subunit b
MLNTPQEQNRSDIESAENNRKKNEEALSKIRAPLDLFRKEANKIVAGARAQAEKVKDDIVASARAESNKMVERAKLEIAQERDKTVVALKDQFAELAVAAASQIIGQTLSPEAHANIIRKTIGDIK